MAVAGLLVQVVCVLEAAVVAKQSAFVLAAALAIQPCEAFARSELVASERLALVDCSLAGTVDSVLAAAGAMGCAKSPLVETVTAAVAEVSLRACVHRSPVGIGTVELPVAVLAVRADCSRVAIVVVALTGVGLVACVGCSPAGTVVAARAVASGG